MLDAFQSLKPKPLHTVTPAEARKGPTFADGVKKVLAAQGKPAQPDATVMTEDRAMQLAGRSLPIRVYTPQGTSPRPLIVYFHGGGFVVADKTVYDAGARALAKDAGAVVVSVDYRLAPEHPYPASLEDAVASFRYVVEHAAEFHGNPAQIAVAGESAGANLATAVALRQKQDSQRLPGFQLLVYPFLSTDVSTPSHVKNGQGNYVIGNQDIAWFWKHELGSGWKTVKDPLALPILATQDQLTGLPPALIITGALDPLKDDGSTYAAHLKAAGVKTELKNYDAVTHEFYGMGAVVDTARQAEKDAATALQRAFASDRGVGGSSGQ